MATSTRRTFTAGYEGPSVNENVKVSQSAAETRAMATQVEGLRSEQSRRAEGARQAQQTVYYRGQGNYSPLGGEPGGYRPKGNVSSGGVPIGQQVPANGGLVGGMPSPGAGDRLALLALTERVAGVARERGPQVGTAAPTPNEVDEANEATDVAARYPQDRYYQTTTRQTWQWVPTVGETPGYWEVAAEPDLLVVGVESPAAQHYPALISNDVRRKIEAISVANYNPDGSPATVATVSLVVSGAPAAVGDIVGPTEYILLNVTAPGAGMMIATIELRQV